MGDEKEAGSRKSLVAFILAENARFLYSFCVTNAFIGYGSTEKPRLYIAHISCNSQKHKYVKSRTKTMRAQVNEKKKEKKDLRMA